MIQIALPAALGVILMVFATLWHLRAHSGSRAVLAIVPPWQQGGMARAARFALPIMDMRGEHLLALDLGEQPDAVSRLRAAGLWLFDASSLRICAGLLALGTDGAGADGQGRKTAPRSIPAGPP